MTEETFDLGRQQQIEALVDALGKQWQIHANRQTGLCYARPNPDREDAVIPKEFQGMWTKASLLKPKILDYINHTWQVADKANADAERKRVAANEYNAKIKAELEAEVTGKKAKNDKRSTTK